MHGKKSNNVTTTVYPRYVLYCLPLLFSKPQQDPRLSCQFNSITVPFLISISIDQEWPRFQTWCPKPKRMTRRHLHWNLVACSDARLHIQWQRKRTSISSWPGVLGPENRIIHSSLPESQELLKQSPRTTLAAPPRRAIPSMWNWIDGSFNVYIRIDVDGQGGSGK